jgi:hypothetical protein
VTEFSLPSKGTPNEIAPGADGSLWFTLWDGNRIGRITPWGKVKEFAVPTSNSGPGGITLGPDANLWFAEEKGNKIARITESPRPRLRLRPDSGSPGASVRIWATGFGAFERLKVSYRDPRTGTCGVRPGKTNLLGHLITTVSVPERATPGSTGYFRGRGRVSKLMARHVFSVR